MILQSDAATANDSNTDSAHRAVQVKTQGAKMHEQNKYSRRARRKTNRVGELSFGELDANFIRALLRPGRALSWSPGQLARPTAKTPP